MSNLPHATTNQPLLQPVRLGALELPNRVVMAPMTRARANNVELAPTAMHATYYAQRAGAGLIISEGTWVSADAIGFVNVPGIFTDIQTAAWTEVTQAVHAAGGKIVSQLGHVGAISHPDHHGGRLPPAPSAINPAEMSFTPTGPKKTLTPRALTAAEIADTIDDYERAAANALRARFDGVEIHAQGPHLIPQFLNPRLNKRTDAYGGNSANRARFLLDVVGAVSGVWGSGRVGIKISPYWSRGTAYTADDATLADYDRLVRRLDDHDLAYLHLMGPQAVAEPEKRLAAFARFRAGYHGRIVANLGFDQATGNDVLERELVDAVSFGAPFIANPDLVERFAHGQALAAGNPDTYYTGDADGYTNYPAAIGAA